MKQVERREPDDSHMRAILCMDVRGYSDLSETEALLLVRAFWPYVAQLARSAGDHILDINTWGDAVFAVIDSGRCASEFALGLREFFSPRRLKANRLPGHLTCRISLHAGDVLETDDPIRKCRGAVGMEVNRCARAEPVTEPGQIFVTQTFYDILGGSRSKYRLEEIGVRELAKGFGAEMLYCLDRRRWGRSGVVSGGKRTVEVPGIVTPEVVARSTHRLPGENFCVELLKEPLELERDTDGSLRVLVKRKGITEIAVSNEGKWAAVAKYVTRRNRPDLLRWDAELQRFLSGGKTDSRPVRCAGGKKRLVFDPGQYGSRLRWASGGVLSIVTYGNSRKEWVPLFFRDIRPYGWNISLGQSERHFDEKGRLKKDQPPEHLEPGRYIEREFLEETVILNRKPVWRKGRLDRVKMVRLDCDAAGLTRNRIEAYHRDYWRRRRDEEDFVIRGYGRTERVRPVPTASHIVVDGIDEPDVLVCFSLLDMGIEVVKVKRYSLKAGEYLVDGEVLFNTDGTSDLIKMPMALLSCDYLREVFGDRNWQQQYSIGPSPSIVASRQPTADEVITFDWDAEERLRVVRGDKSGSPFQQRRFLQWSDMFAAGVAPAAHIKAGGNLPALFVPGTAKILNLYFSRETSGMTGG